jgi:DNA-binding transcriptional LysR family regulator
MLDLEDVRIFAEIADAGGLTRAARRLGVSKSHLSRRLLRIEEALGAQLLTRTPKGAALTEAGANFKPFAERMLAEMAAARDVIAAPDEPTGELRIAAPISFGIAYIAPILAELALRHPRLKVQAFYSDRPVDLVGERFDAAIWIGSLPDSALLARRIAPIRWGVVGSPGYIARAGEPMRLEDLDQHRVLLHADQPWRFATAAGVRTIRPRGDFVADNSQALLAAALAGVGLAMLPSFLIGSAIVAGELTPVLRNDPCPEDGLFVLRAPAPGVPASKIKALTKLLVERFGRDLEWDTCQRDIGSAVLPKVALGIR